MSRRDRLMFYRDAEGQWRWRLCSSNGRILADSGQGYSRRVDCAHGADRTLNPLTRDDLVVEVYP